jgi:LacI family transcriptional regulator
MTTLEEIARHAQTSRSTVSRVINNDPNVKESTRKRIQDVIQRLNYQPNQAARSLAGGFTHVLGLVIPTGVASVFSDPYFPTLIRGISTTCQEREYSVMLWLAEPEYERRTVMQVLQNGFIDGIIVSSMPIDEKMIEALITSRLPFILVGRHPQHPEVSYVDVENQAGARQAVEHLLARGRQRIACLCGPLNTIVGIDRQKGYLDALKAYGIPLNPKLIQEGDFSEEAGYRLTRSLLPHQPDAIFAASDAMAIGAIRLLHEEGLTVPEQVAVIGFDDMPFAARSQPPLTTVRQPILQTGALAAERLIAFIEDPEHTGYQHIILPTELIVRESCGAKQNGFLPNL